MITLTSFIQGDSTPLAVRLILRKGNRKRDLWLPKSVIIFFGSRIALKENWLWEKTIRPVLAQGWQGVEVIHE